MPEQRLGELLLGSKLITAEQRQKALEMQQQNPFIPIGQILCKLGFITEDNLSSVLDIYHKREQLGSLLVRKNLVTAEKLEAALEISRKEHILLGQALLSLHAVNEKDLARVIASQFDLPFVELEKYYLNTELSGYVNMAYAKRNHLVPIEFLENQLTIAVANPLPIDDIKQIEQFLHVRIKQVVAVDSEITAAQHKVYSKDAVIFDKDKSGIFYEMIEDVPREMLKSKYVADFITTDVENLVKRIISVGISAGASDIHLEPVQEGMFIRYRIDGVLQELNLYVDPDYLASHSRQIISRIKVLCDMDIAERRRPQDSSFKINITKGKETRSIDFRVSTVPNLYGESLVMRILDKKGINLSLESLGYFPDVIEPLFSSLDKPTGLFLVTGPTGSGKSSTLYAMLGHINTPGTKTLTVEDPVEYTIDGVCQSEVNEVIGNSFARILRSFLRQDPDNIMIGEIRDAETASIAVRAALTGHTVLSTLHTNDATSAVTRLIDMGVEPNLLSTTLRGVIAQRLVRKCCVKCLTEYQPETAVLKEFAITTDAKILYRRGKGCESCNYTGFAGRLPITELWIPSRDELGFVHSCPDNIDLRERIFGDGTRRTLFEEGLIRVLRQETTMEELLKVVPSEQVMDGRVSLDWQRLAKLSKTII